MSEDVSLQSPAKPAKAGNRWLNIIKRILVGVVMVLAMLFLPAATALPWCNRIPTALILSMILSVIFLSGGLILSVEQNLPLSQSVGGLGFCALVASHAAARVFKH